MSDSFPVRVIGGRALPSFPDTHADCSTQWKRLPNERVTRKAFEELNSQGLWKPPVLMTGVRAAESNARDARIAHRGEVAEGIWVNDLGALRASPILDFDVDSVWEYLGLCAAGVIPAYSDFAETMRIYRDAGGSSCVIVADMKLQGQSKPCSARTGCWICTKVKTDHSATQMMASNPERNGWLKPLNDLRNFISHTQYDWTRRHYVMRTIDKDGFITIGPDTYSPAMLQELENVGLGLANIRAAQQMIGAHCQHRKAPLLQSCSGQLRRRTSPAEPVQGALCGVASLTGGHQVGLLSDAAQVKREQAIQLPAVAGSIDRTAAIPTR